MQTRRAAALRVVWIDRLLRMIKGNGLRERALRGSAWTFVGFGLGQALRLGSTLVLSRLLFPEAFGLMALVGVFMQGLEMMSDVGLRGSVIHHQRGDDADFLNTAWTMQVVRGFALWGIACLLAWPLARLYDEPTLQQIIPLAGLSAVIAGFNTTKVFTANRNLEIGRMVLINLSVRIFKVSVLIALAWWLRSVWALVLGGLATAVAQNLMNHFALPGPFNRFRWERSASRDLIRYGKWVMVSTVFMFLASQIDRILLGKFVGMDLLGVYSIAMTFVLTSKAILDKISSTILMPGLANKLRSGQMATYSSLIYRTRWLLGGLGACMIVVMALLAPLFFITLFDARYHAAGWITQLLCMGLWFGVLNSGTISILLASGDSRSVAVGNVVNTIVTIVLAPLAYLSWGVPGFIVGWSLGNLAGLVTLYAVLHRQFPNLWKIDLLITAASAATAVLAITLQYQLVRQSELPKWFCLVGPASVVALVVIAFGLRYRRAIFKLLAN